MGRGGRGGSKSRHNDQICAFKRSSGCSEKSGLEGAREDAEPPAGRGLLEFRKMEKRQTPESLRELK